VIVKVNVVFTVPRIRLMIGLWLGLVLTIVVYDLRSGDSKGNVYHREYPRITTSIIKKLLTVQSADKLHHPISVTYSAELVLLNK